MYLWNPVDIGYLAGNTMDALVKKTITGKTGDKFTAGTLGEKTVTDAADGGTEVMLGDPFKFDPENICRVERNLLICSPYNFYKPLNLHCGRRPFGRRFCVFFYCM